MLYQRLRSLLLLLLLLLAWGSAQRSPNLLPQIPDHGPSKLAERKTAIAAREAAALKNLTVERDVFKHNFTFIVGAHHSGTTLIDLLTCLSPDATCLNGTGVSQDEGSHLQSVYLEDRLLGGMLRYGFDKGSHITERDSRVNNVTTLRLFGSWSPFWNLTRRTCVEKSPPHLTKTRFFQALFTRERTRFVVLLRHPLATTHFVYERYHNTRGGAGCGRDWVRHFLVIYRILLADMLEGLDPDHVMFVPYEHLMGHGLADAAAGEARMQRLMHRYYEFLGLTPAEHDLRFEIPAAATSSTQAGQSQPGLAQPRPEPPKGAAQHLHSGLGSAGLNRRLLTLESRPGPSAAETAAASQSQAPAQAARQSSVPADLSATMSESALSWSPSRPGRQLLEYHGSRRNVSVRWSDPLAWIEDFHTHVTSSSDECQKLAGEVDEELLKLGYSIKNLSYVGKPQLPAGHLLWED